MAYETLYGGIVLSYTLALVWIPSLGLWFLGPGAFGVGL